MYKNNLKLLKMESIKELVANTIENEIGWSKYSEPLSSNIFETSNTNASVQGDVNIKVEIELKEEENGLIYKPDFSGQLRLVSLNQNVPSNCSVVESIPEWHCIQSVSEMKETFMVSSAQNNRFSNECIYGQLKNAPYHLSGDTKETSAASNFQTSISQVSEIYGCTFESPLQQQITKSSQLYRHKRKREPAYILAEKKRNYRMRIKEENPGMWCVMKQKEACKKREQREEKRLILLEMQKMMHLVALPDSPEVENHKLCLEVLKERYPEIWRQLIAALSAAEQREQELKNENSSKRHLSKPVKIYKDVVEAQKKYLYRQRIKLERPDLYEQQKARDSYARSIRRMLKKKLTEAQNNISN